MKQKITIDQILSEAKSSFALMSQETAQGNMRCDMDDYEDEDEYEDEDMYQEALEDELWNLSTVDLYESILNEIKEKYNLKGLLIGEEHFEQYNPHDCSITHIAKYHGDVITCSNSVDNVVYDGVDSFAEADLWIDAEYYKLDEDYIDACKEITDIEDNQEAVDKVVETINELLEYYNFDATLELDKMSIGKCLDLKIKYNSDDNVVAVDKNGRKICYDNNRLYIKQ